MLFFWCGESHVRRNTRLLDASAQSRRWINIDRLRYRARCRAGECAVHQRMGTPRLDPRDRVEQSQLAAALAASRTLDLAAPQHAEVIQLPPPTATKYGDLGSGTLLTTTTEATTTASASGGGSIVRKSSDDRLLARSDPSNGRMRDQPHAACVRIDPADPTARSRLPSSIHSSGARAPRRTLIDSAELPPLALALETGSTLAGVHDSIAQDETAEVIGDSDEESRRQSRTRLLPQVSGLQLPLSSPD